MKTRSIDVITSTPGIWVCIMDAGVALIEVLPDGKVYQLDPDTMQQDGELRPGGWNLDCIQWLLGPLGRPA